MLHSCRSKPYSCRLKERPVALARMRGVVMVETAIVLPVLLVLLLGTAELGRIFYSYNTVNKIAREGARYLSGGAFTGGVPVVDLTAQRIAATRNFVVYGNAAGSGTPVLSNLRVSDVTVSSVGGNFVTVDVNYPQVPMFGPLLPMFGFGNDLDVSFPLRAAVTMRAIN